MLWAPLAWIVLPKSVSKAANRTLSSASASCKAVGRGLCKITVIRTAIRADGYAAGQDSMGVALQVHTSSVVRSADTLSIIYLSRQARSGDPSYLLPWNPSPLLSLKFHTMQYISPWLRRI